MPEPLETKCYSVVTGQFYNRSSTDFDSVAVTVELFNADGVVMGGFPLAFENLLPGERRLFKVREFLAAANVARSEFSAGWATEEPKF